MAYSLEKILRERASWPKFLPLEVEIQHSWYLHDTPFYEDLLNTDVGMLVHNRFFQKRWEAVSGVPAAIVGNPMILFRRKAGVERKSNAEGTIAFPQQGTGDIRLKFDVEGYCEALKKLPKKHFPISICLHYWDIKFWEKRAAYEKSGFNIVTAGDPHAEDFVKNFYDLLSSYRYATSNTFAMAAICAVEMGIPFFLHGNLGTQENVALCGGKKGKSGNEGRLYALIDNDGNPVARQQTTAYPRVKEAFSLFSKRTDVILPEQKAFIEREIGIKEALSPKELKKLLLKSFLKKRLMFFREKLRIRDTLALFVDKHLKPFNNPQKLLAWLKKRNFQSSLDSLAAEHAGKTILLFPHGNLTQLLYKHFDLSKLNIVGISDASFYKKQPELPYPCIVPFDIQKNPPELILVPHFFPQRFSHFLKHQLKLPEKTQIRPLSPQKKHFEHVGFI